ncbi:MAG: toll/interleukin-1 receptor domain-containing protein [bacterium]
MADGSERDVFISHEKTDADVALELAAQLRASGYSTWCYEEDSTAGGSYLVQIDRAIEAAHSMVVIISKHSLRSPHVRNEIIRAYESQKRFIPIRRGMSHDDVLRAQDEGDDDRRREWRMAFGAAVSVAWDPDNSERVAAKVAEGLKRVGVPPTSAASPYAPPRISTVPRTAPPAFATSQTTSAQQFDAREAGARFVADLGLPTDAASIQKAFETPIARVIVAGLVGALGVIGNLQTLFGAIAPGPQDFGYIIVPLTRLINIVAALLGLWLSVRLVRGAWALFQGDASAENAIRRTASQELFLIFSWFAVTLLVIMFGVPQEAATARSPMLSYMIRGTLMASVPVAICRYMFTRARTGAQHPA